MTRFDLTESAGQGYKLAWGERRYLTRLAAVPFLIKMVCFTTVSLLGWDFNFIRQALIMLPSYFADGWLLSHLVRFVFLGQRWPFRPTGDTAGDLRALQDRASGIMAGTLMFVVIKFLMAGVIAFLYATTGGTETAPVKPDFGMFMLGMAFFFAFFWGFRLLWLYVPAAVNYPPRQYLRDCGGYMMSFHLIGVWLVSFVPFFIAFNMLHTGLVSGFSGQASVEALFLSNLLRAVTDTLIGVVSTAAVAWGLRQYVMPGFKKDV